MSIPAFLVKVSKKLGVRTKKRPLLGPLDPVQRNSREVVDELWGNTEFVGSYLSKERLSFYEFALAFAAGAGVFNGAESIADIGCGPGYFLKVLRQKYPRVRLVGMDFSCKAIEVARSRCSSAELRQHDIYAPLPEPYDAVSCMEVLEHLFYPQRALDNLVATASGVLLTVPNGRLDKFAGHINFWSIESWKTLLESYADDFECETALTENGKYIMSALKRRKL